MACPVKVYPFKMARPVKLMPHLMQYEVNYVAQLRMIRHHFFMHIITLHGGIRYPQQWIVQPMTPSFSVLSTFPRSCTFLPTLFLSVPSRILFREPPPLTHMWSLAELI